MDGQNIAAAVAFSAWAGVILVLFGGWIRQRRRDARTAAYFTREAAARCYCGWYKCAWSATGCPKHAQPGEWEAFITTDEGQDWARRHRPDCVRPAA
ncbi:hypothetical protein [Longimicrobium sp.]|jgi:hypothetical protein|uniref:hypothetical protein n=1 Tax=Longimicrobium sp. TaxID=2029185 RepID=UPI002F94FC33